jgi:hypothetical protein
MVKLGQEFVNTYEHTAVPTKCLVVKHGLLRADPACQHISPGRRDPAIARFILVDRGDMTDLAL